MVTFVIVLWSRITNSVAHCSAHSNSSIGSCATTPGERNHLDSSLRAQVLQMVLLHPSAIFMLVNVSCKVSHSLRIRWAEEGSRVSERERAKK